MIINTLNQENWKNKNGTSNRSCPDGNWKAYWENHSGKSWPSKCSRCGCNHAAEVGAHLYRANESKKEYIVPLCSGCNHLIGTFSLRLGTICVPANTSEVRNY